MGGRGRGRGRRGRSGDAAHGEAAEQYTTDDDGGDELLEHGYSLVDGGGGRTDLPLLSPGL
jgi:hypothetical protein